MITCTLTKDGKTEKVEFSENTGLRERLYGLYIVARDWKRQNFSKIVLCTYAYNPSKDMLVMKLDNDMTRSYKILHEGASSTYFLEELGFTFDLGNVE